MKQGMTDLFWAYPEFIVFLHDTSKKNVLNVHSSLSKITKMGEKV